MNDVEKKTWRSDCFVPPERARTGLRYKNGRLYFFNLGSIVVLQGYPARCWTKTIEKPTWHSGRPPGECIPQQPLARALGWPTNRKFLGKSEFAWHDFLKNLPPGFLEGFGVLNYSRGYWQLLKAFGYVPGLLPELVLGPGRNPALALALAHLCYFKKNSHPQRCARSLLKRPRREILGALGFPATNAMVNLFSKITDLTSISPCLLANLRDLANEGNRGVKTMGHLSQVNALMIRVLHAYRRAPASLLEELSTRGFCDGLQAAFEMEDLVEMCRRIGADLPAPARVRNLERLHEVHQELVERVNTRNFNPQSPFPPVLGFSPPVQSNLTIEPITRYSDLLAIGRRMHHCVAIYADQVSSGNYACFKVVHTGPTMASAGEYTLGLRRFGDRFCFEQLRGPANSSPPADLEAEVKDWLETVELVPGAPSRSSNDEPGPLEPVNYGLNEVPF